MGVNRIWLLDSGSLVIDRSHVMWNIDAGNPVRFPVYSVLIDHTDGLFLFDSGFDKGTVEEFLAFELPEQTDEQILPAQLESCGFSVADVTAVINSHLHFDHCGGQRHLPAATDTWVGKEELRHCLVPEPFERLGYADKVHHRPDSAYRWLEGDEVDFADGIRLLFTPGHTVGHYSLLLERNGRAPMLFCVDVTYTQETWEKELISGFHNDPTANFASLRTLKHLAQRSGAEVFFPHDMEAWESYKHAPDNY
jgi:4-pyridoxolactonase